MIQVQNDLCFAEPYAGVKYHFAGRLSSHRFATIDFIKPSGRPTMPKRDYKEESKRSFDRIAPYFDRHSFGRHSQSLHGPLARLVGGLSEESLLDVGCGDGRFLAELSAARFNNKLSARFSSPFPDIPRSPRLAGLEQGPLSENGKGNRAVRKSGANPIQAYPRRLFGIDISPEMIRCCRRKLPAIVEVKVGDAENIPYEREQFDIVVCINAFHHYPHPGRAISEMNRVLKPNGHAIIGDVGVPGPFRPIVNFSLNFFRMGDFRFYSGKEFRKLLIQAGFQDIQVKRQSIRTTIAMARK